MKHKFTHSRREYGYVVGTIPGAAWLVGSIANAAVLGLASRLGEAAAVVVAMLLAAIPALLVRFALLRLFIEPTDEEDSADVMRQFRGVDHSALRDLGSKDHQ